MTMDRSIHVRLDDTAQQALDELRASGVNAAEIVRSALADAAVRSRLRKRHQNDPPYDPNDPAEREELRIISELMASVAPQWDDT